MYVRKTTYKCKGRVYTNFLLVESVRTPKGPRQKTICTLGDLGSRSIEEWRKIAHKVEARLSGARSLFSDECEGDGKEERAIIEGIIKKIRTSSGDARYAEGSPVLEGNGDTRSRKESEKLKNRGNRNNKSIAGGNSPTIVADLVHIHTDRVRTERHREGGSVHAGVSYWNRLGMPEILKQLGFSERESQLTCAMVMNRLIHPKSEYAMPQWIRSTALDDLLDEDFSSLTDDSLYRHLDRIYPYRSRIESLLCERERNLFNLDQTVFFYDLTSTYFEGLGQRNAKAKRGYSRDRRPDCLQVVVGLVINRDGFPLCHEVFDGNLPDNKSLGPMLDALERRVGLKEGQTVVVDRGMAFDSNLDELRKRGLNYIVASRQPERDKWLADFSESEDFEEVLRTPSPRNLFQKKSKVWIKMRKSGDKVYVLCFSEGRRQKDRAIRESKEKKFLTDLEKLSKRISGGRLKEAHKISQAVGRLLERYPRVARYYAVNWDPEYQILRIEVDRDRLDRARRLDGAYILKSNRMELSAEEVWMTYMLLTRAETAFRDMKSPLAERPIFHQLEHRVDTHIFLCVIAYHILISIEKQLLDKGIHTSWATVRDTLSTHQVSTVVLPTSTHAELHIRQDSVPEEKHKELYRLLEIPTRIMKPVKTWVDYKK